MESLFFYLIQTHQIICQTGGQDTNASHTWDARETDGGPAEWYHTDIIPQSWTQSMALDDITVFQMAFQFEVINQNLGPYLLWIIIKQESM